jgi:hypothetical protein
MTDHELIALGIEYRGTVLDACVYLEKWIDTYIVYYFTWDGDIAMEMLELVLDRVSFDSKISIFEAILKKKTKDLFKKTHSKLFSELRFVKDERNKFAHYIQKINNETNVVLICFRNSQTHYEYTGANYELLLSRIEKCAQVVKDMSSEMWGVDESGSPYRI